MPRYIDAEQMEKHIMESKVFNQYFKELVQGLIWGENTIDAVPVVRGEWKHTGITNVYGGHQHKCSVCGYSLMVSQSCDNENYCYGCGAKMVGHRGGKDES